MKNLILFIVVVCPLFVSGQEIPKIALSIPKVLVGYDFVIDFDKKPYESQFKAEPSILSKPLIKEKNLPKCKDVSFRCVGVVTEKSFDYLVFSNPKIGNFYYSADLMHSMPLKPISEIRLHDSIYCNMIRIKKDKFDNSIRYSTDTDPYDNTFLYKYIKNNDTTYSLVLYIYTSDATLGEGVTILLENGKRIERKELKISVDYSTTMRAYSNFASIELTKEEISIIQNNQITDFKLYIHERVPLYPDRLKIYMNCLVSK